jgi:hypothetical protein
MSNSENWPYANCFTFSTVEDRVTAQLLVERYDLAIKHVREVMAKYKANHGSGWHDTECCITDMLEELEKALE